VTTARPALSGLRSPAQAILWSAVALAWALIVLADATGFAGALHHHALIEGGVALPAAVGLFAAGWVVMVAAMMLPASSVAIQRHGGAVRFIAAYMATWTAFGLACFAGDAVIHRTVDATPWLAANSWIVAAGTLVLAGVYQLLPVKRRFLDACRVPATSARHDHRGAGSAGIAHAVDCIGATGPLMLLMFAAGFASLAWMVALTALMLYEVRGTRSAAVVRASGVLLIWLAVLTSISGVVPGWVGA
jgi:predicted metal-binding membrane protein